MREFGNLDPRHNLTQPAQPRGVIEFSRLFDRGGVAQDVPEIEDPRPPDCAMTSGWRFDLRPRWRGLLPPCWTRRTGSLPRL